MTSHRTDPILRTPWALFVFLLVLGFGAITSVVLAVNSSDGTDPIWGARTGDAPAWLVMPATYHQLYSHYEFAYLAGNLIAYKDVDANSCTDGAFLQGGAANECSLPLALSAVFAWQNQFNQEIMAASQETGVPPIVLKNIFSWESQFWPKTGYVNTYEYGLGHITEAGADSVLRWNKPFYIDLCRNNFTEDTCRTNYAEQTAHIRAAMMGAVVKLVKADCSECPYGLDIPLVRKSIPVFANTLLANANLVKQTVNSLTGKPAYQSVSYEDLWKFSLTSYNAGPGCFVTAFSRTLRSYQTLDWTNFSAQLDPGCRGAIKYVTFISDSSHFHPENDPDLVPDPIEEPTGLPTDVPSEIPTDAPTTIPVEGTPTPDLDYTLVPSLQPTEEITATGTSTPQNETSEIGLPGTETTSTPTFEPTIEPLPEKIIEQLDSPHVLDQVILKIDPARRSAALDVLKTLGINLVQDSDQVGSLDTLIIQVTSDQLGEILAALQTSSAVVYAEPNYLVSLASLPNDPEIASQENLWNIQVPQAWDALPSMQEVLVAVVDTGVDYNHPDLVNAIWQNVGETGLDESGNDKRSNGFDDDGNGYIDDWQGWNMVSSNNDPADDQGHGTHLAGVIGATVNNGLGIAGIAPNARILPVKVLDNTGYGTYAQVAEGIYYATDFGVRVINLGFAGLGSSQMMQDAVDYAVAHGVLVVAASGNGGMNTTYFPAAYPGVIAVSAVDSVLNRATFSSSGDHISLVAPGIGIYSTYLDGTYKTFSGTSISSAHVSGVAALLAGQSQFADLNDLISALLNSAIDLGAPGKDPYFGYGIVHAYDALGYSGPVLPTPTPWAVPSSTPGGSGGVYIQATQDLWGRAQTSTYAIVDPANSIDSSFNDLTANSTGPFGGSSTRRWTFTSFDDTTFTTVARVELDLRMYMTGWLNDTYYIQVYDPTNLACGGTGWCTVFNLQYSVSGSNQMQPPSTLTTITIDVSNLLNSAERVNNAQVRLAGSGLIAGSAENVTVYMDEVRLRVLDELPPTPTPTSTPIFVSTPTLPAERAITATPLAVEPHNSFLSANVDTCAACHRSHTAQSASLRNNTGEEQVCFTCHTSGGSGTNVQLAFTSFNNTSTSYYKHPVSSSLNIHQAGETLSVNFGGNLRHIECEDCHNPHSTARTDPSASVIVPAIQQEMYESSGVDPIWTAVGAPSSYTWLDKAEREYQVCLKCHSSYATLPTYSPDGYGWASGSDLPDIAPNGLGKLTSTNPVQILDNRDMAAMFNPYLLSYHPVASMGRNQNIPAGSFVTGWSKTSMVYCTDCHQNSTSSIYGEGPHGSGNLHILAGSSDYITIDNSALANPIHDTGEVCFNCHQFGTYVNGTNSPSTTNFRDVNKNLHMEHDFTACYTCHNSHGSEQSRLINFDTQIVAISAPLNSQTAWGFAGGVGSCTLACHGMDHDTDKSYTP